MSKKVENYIIWVFWAQDVAEMPPLVKSCYYNLYKKTRNENVKLITMNNIDNYIQLPDYVKKSRKKGIIGYTHLSDIIRNSLLSQYGGLWVDATVWLAQELPIDVLKELRFFSAKQSIYDSHWVSYLLGTNETNLELFCFVRDMLISFCQKEKYWPDYLVQDYLISYAYYKFSYIRDIMDECPDNNPRRSDLWIRMNKPFDKEDYRRIIKENWMYKLSYKSKLQTNVNGNLTYYGAILNGQIDK